MVRNRAVELFADGDSLIRAMVNLLDNAIQFSKPGTTTSICSNNWSMLCWGEK